MRQITYTIIRFHLLNLRLKQKGATMAILGHAASAEDIVVALINIIYLTLLILLSMEQHNNA